jgi:hypothetical protein
MSLTHPFDPDSLYELMEDGNIRLTNGGREGIFSPAGVHISGEIREADPQICVWVSNVPEPATQLATSRIAGRDSGTATS